MMRPPPPPLVVVGEGRGIEEDPYIEKTDQGD